MMPGEAQKINVGDLAGADDHRRSKYFGIGDGKIAEPESVARAERLLESREYLERFGGGTLTARVSGLGNHPYHAVFGDRACGPAFAVMA